MVLFVLFQHLMLYNILQHSLLIVVVVKEREISVILFLKNYRVIHIMKIHTHPHTHTHSHSHTYIHT